MAIHSTKPILMTQSSTLVTDSREVNAGIVGRVFARSREFWCGLHGHDNLMHVEKDRLFLECVSCGHESPGWVLTAVPPKVVQRGAAGRHALAPPRSVTEA